MTTLNVVDYGAVGDGTTDDTAAIQSAIDDANAGDTVYLPQPDDYYLVSDSTSNYALVFDSTHADDVTIRGDGEDTMIKMADVDVGSDVLVLLCDRGPIDVTVENLVLDGNNDVNPRDDVEIRGLYIDNGGSGRSDCDIHIENVRVQHCSSGGFFERNFTPLSGTDTVTMRNCTALDTGSDGFSIGSNVRANSEDDIRSTYKSLKSIDGGIEGVFGNGIAIIGSILVEDLYVENGGQGNKLSHGNLYAVMRNGRFVEHNGNHAMRETIPQTSDDGDWEFHMDNIRFEDSDLAAMRLGGNSPDSRDHVTIGEVEVVNVDRTGDHGYAIGVTADQDFDADTIHVYDVPNNGVTTWSSSGGGTIGTINYDNVGGSVDNAGSLSVNNVEQQSGPVLDVPGKDDVGAFADAGDEDNEVVEEEENDETDDDGGVNEPNESPETWTPRWDSSGDDWSVVERSEYTGGAALAFEHDGGDFARYAISYDGIGEPSDVEVVDKFRVPEFTDHPVYGFHARVHLRSSTVDGNERGYWIQIEDRADAFTLGKYDDDGDVVAIDQFGTPEEDTFYYRRFRAEGDQLKAKVWPAADPEPSGWDVETTDADHSEGWIGLGSYDAELVETDLFSVATGGDAARISASDDVPTASWVAPDDGETISDTTLIQLDTGDTNTESVSVEYRVGDGEWQSTEYDSESGYHVDNWNSANVDNGTHTLEARVDASDDTNTSIEVTVENTIAVETMRASEIAEDSSVLTGELIDLGGNDEVTAGFEWRPSDSDDWTTVGERSMDSTGEFTHELGDLENDTEYEFRAIAEGDERETGDVTAFVTDSNEDGEEETEEEKETSLSIDQFDVEDRGGQIWTRFDIDWAVSDSNGNLDTVVTKLLTDGVTVAAESTSINGESASFSHAMRVRGDVDEVRLLVNDTSNRTKVESAQV